MVDVSLVAVADVVVKRLRLLLGVLNEKASTLVEMPTNAMQKSAVVVVVEIFIIIFVRYGELL